MRTTATPDSLTTNLNFTRTTPLTFFAPTKKLKTENALTLMLRTANGTETKQSPFDEVEREKSATTQNAQSNRSPRVSESGPSDTLTIATVCAKLNFHENVPVAFTKDGSPNGKNKMNKNRRSLIELIR